VSYSNSTELLTIIGKNNNTTFSLSTKEGSEVWIPSGGLYRITCNTCTSPVNVVLKAEIYRVRGSLPVLVLSLILGLAGGLYAMVSLINHFASLALRRRGGG